jgi:2-dehydro-3-deoxy-D-arabinonate dehydratase
MKVYKTDTGILIGARGKLYSSKSTSLDSFLNQDNLYGQTELELTEENLVSDSGFLNGYTLEAPVQSQEIWAAGVTYLRSRDARKEESKEAGGASFYDKVYDAERPELFFKATPHRCVGPGGKVRIRKDSKWNVPEPELTLVINNKGEIVGYTVGNDMSSRSIEGENPLYLPQAKTYDGAAAVGPCIYISERPIDPASVIKMEIFRAGEVVYSDAVEINRMKRGHTELVEFLYRECSFPHGCLLMTGTCLVPPNDFTLQSGDEIAISIDHIGTLKNIVE